MNVAVSERFYDTDKSQWVNTETQWFRAVAWNALEISEAKQLDKGSIVSVEGRININDYEDKEGNKRQSYEVTVSDISEIVRREKKAA
jgi:single-strand DNA-binding protein